MPVAAPAKTIAPFGPSRTMRSRACSSSSVVFTWFPAGNSEQALEIYSKLSRLIGPTRTVRINLRLAYVGYAPGRATIICFSGFLRPVSDEQSRGAHPLFAG